MTALFLNHLIFIYLFFFLIFIFIFIIFALSQTFGAGQSYKHHIYYLEAGEAIQPPRCGWFGNELDFFPGDSTAWGF